MKKPFEAEIEDVVIQPNKIQPIIVNFQNGHLKDEETKKMKCGLYNDEKNKKTVLALSNGQIVYKGYRPDLDKELTYTMLAIHNKKTGKVRLIQAERWDVCPVLDEHIENNNEEDEDKTAILNKQFGSKKAKRKTEQFERMKVNVDNVKEQLEQTVSNIQIEKEDLEPASKDDIYDGTCVPPCNREASEASEVYNIDDIVPKNILKTLYSQAVEVSENGMDKKPNFFIKTLEKVKNDAKCAVKIAMLLYIEAVIDWIHKPIRLARRNDLVVCPYSSDVNNHVLETYSVVTANGRQRPNTMKDKGIIHCLILGLMIWNYTLDLELFSSLFQIRIGVKKLQELARLICATSARDKKSIILSLPLPPLLSKAKSKKK